MLSVGMLLHGCTTSTEKACAVGAKVECMCTTGGMGFKECKSDQTGYGACAGCVVLDFTILKDFAGLPAIDLEMRDLEMADGAGANPDTAMPDLNVPDAAMSMPDAAMPDAAMPDTAMPDTAMPDLTTSMADMAMPDLAMPD